MELKENAVELWCEEFKKRCNTSLNEKQGEVLIVLLLNQENFNKNETIIKEIEDGNSYLTVLARRIKNGNFTYTVTPAGLLFLESLVENFGTSTMICAYLQWVSYKKGIKEFDIDNISKEVFPFGFPSDKDLNELWDMQKVRGEMPDNGLDWRITYKSIIS